MERINQEIKIKIENSLKKLQDFFKAIDEIDIFINQE